MSSGTPAEDVRPFVRGGVDLRELLQPEHETFDHFLTIWRGAKTEREICALLDHLPHIRFVVPSNFREDQFNLDDGATACQKLEFLLEVASPPLADRESERQIRDYQREALRSIGVLLNNRERVDSLVRKASGTLIAKLVNVVKAWSEEENGFYFGSEGASRGNAALIDLASQLLRHLIQEEWGIEFRSEYEWQKRQCLQAFQELSANRQGLVNLLLRHQKHQYFDYEVVLPSTVRAVASYIMFEVPGLPAEFPSDPWELANSTNLILNYLTGLRIKEYLVQDEDRRQVKAAVELLQLLLRITPLAQVNERILWLPRPNVR